MEIKILSERENPLLNRKDVRFEVSFTGGIKSRKEIRREIILKLKSKDELTIMNGLKTQFGKQRVEGYAKVYKDKESLKVEPEYRVEKNFRKEEKKEKSEEEKSETEKEGKEPGEEKEGKLKEEKKESEKKEKKPKIEEEIKEEKKEKSKEEVKELKPEEKEKVKKNG